MGETCFFKDCRLYSSVHSLHTRPSPGGHARELHAIHRNFWNMNTCCCICRHSAKWQQWLIKTMQILVFSFCLAYNLSFKIFPLFWIFGTVDTEILAIFLVTLFCDTHVAEIFHINILYSTAHISQTFWHHDEQKVISHIFCLEIFNDSILIM